MKWKREEKRKWKCREYSEEGKIKALLRRQRRNGAWYIFRRWRCDVCGRTKLRQYLHIYLWSTIPRTPRNDAGSFRRNTGKRQGASETNGEVELSPTSSCVQKKFPSENSEAIPDDQPPRCFFQSRSSTGKRSRPGYSPSSSAFRFYILSFSLFLRRLYVARRGRRKKSTPLAQIFLFMYTWHIKISTSRIIRAVC